MDSDIAALEDAEREAYAAYKVANDRLSDARKALRDAKLNATGLAGHLVSVKERWGYSSNPPKYREYKFVVDGLAYGRRVQGRILRADGTLGTMRKDAEPEKVTDLGPYTPTA